MAFSAANVITEVRRLIQDTESPARYTDEVIVGFINQVLYKMLAMRPDLFSYINTAVATTADTVLQSLPAGASQLIDVFSVTLSGTKTAVTESTREVFDQTYPGWVGSASGTPTTFMRHKRNPLRYMLYPAPSAGVTVTAEYSRVPATVNDVAITAATKADNIRDVPDMHFSTVVDGTVYMCESVDDEYTNDGRAKLALDTFLAVLGASAKSKDAIETTAAQTPKDRPSGSLSS